MGGLNGPMRSFLGGDHMPLTVSTHNSISGGYITGVRSQRLYTLQVHEIKAGKKLLMV